jgi:hypothetical protein
VVCGCCRFCVSNQLLLRVCFYFFVAATVGTTTTTFASATVVVVQAILFRVQRVDFLQLNAWAAVFQLAVRHRTASREDSRQQERGQWCDW